ncbi:unnamed protein product [Cuscuta campestris]|uniref:Uncharacterized protein n=1 Tax=Cuscuta campestris TaxID=132261 RepID=A0A484M2U5_9ASTE|nr:unnamed protein product [Cuscuta campestris]
MLLNKGISGNNVIFAAVLNITLLQNVPGGDIQPDVFNRLSYLLKVEVRRAHFNDFVPSYNVIDICFDEKTISQFKETNSTFFLVQIKTSFCS